MTSAAKRRWWIQSRCTPKDGKKRSQLPTLFLWMASVFKRQKLRGNSSRNTPKDEEEKWSQLPTLFLWMVKDQLNLCDNACFSSVCKNWNLASRSYTPEPRNHSALPWIIHILPRSTLCELLNFSTMEKIVLDAPEFNGSPRILFSRRGWLLLYVLGQPSVVLYDLLNNAKIEIQIPEKIEITYTGASFSFTDDLKHTPHYMVFATFGRKHLNMFIFDVGTKIWKKHLHEIGRRGGQMHGLSLRVVGNHVYLLTDLGTTFIFDMMSVSWKEIVPWNGSNFLSHVNTIRMTETEEGDIVQIVRTYNADAKKHFVQIFMLNDNKSCWEVLSDVNMCWFMSCFRKNNLDLAMKGRKNVYRLGETKVEKHGSSVKQTIHVHDIGMESSVQCEENHGSTDSETVYIHVILGDSNHREKKYAEWFECSWTNESQCIWKNSPWTNQWIDKKCPYAMLGNGVEWIDLGWIDKVPPSCVGTKLLPCRHS